MDAPDDYLLMSGIQHFAFCRRQWALIHLEQQWAENLRTTEGQLDHARNFILGKVYNARWVLERATRDHPQRVPVEQLKQTSAQLAAALPLLETCEDLEQLRGLEGEAAQRYFDRFHALILQQKEDFVFTSRSRRPPRDNVNALLSFAYSLLANDCAAAPSCTPGS